MELNSNTPSKISLAICQEIQRFESVHPSIYALYELIDLIPDKSLHQQIRDHVICIESSFVNNQEWTLPRNVKEFKIGLLGNDMCGKAALVYRYLTGRYTQEDGLDGGRYKKEVKLNGQSYLLLLRDEAGPPDQQFSDWIDAVIFVFSVENENSFQTVYNYYSKLSYMRKLIDIPVFLVGTQDYVSASNRATIDEAKTKKLSDDLRACAYYETCSTYGLGIDKMFLDVCEKILERDQWKLKKCMMATLNNPNITKSPIPNYPQNHSSPNYNNGFQSDSNVSTTNLKKFSNIATDSQNQPSCVSRIEFKNALAPIIRSQADKISHPNNFNGGIPYPSNSNHELLHHIHERGDSTVTNSTPINAKFGKIDGNSQNCFVKREDSLNMSAIFSNPSNPIGLSSQSNIKKTKGSFVPQNNADIMGIGRVIPIKQGWLYKKSSKSLNKEWKKKYVTLNNNGTLVYHSNIQDYMNNENGKEISLLHTTVKVPGQHQQLQTIPSSTSSSSISNNVNANQIHLDFNKISLGQNSSVSQSFIKRLNSNIQQHLTSHSHSPVSNHPPSLGLLESSFSSKSINNQMNQIDNQAVETGSNNAKGNVVCNSTPMLKKKHRRNKSGENGENYDFIIVSLDNKQWHFDASSAAERQSWVRCVEAQILNWLSQDHSRQGPFNNLYNPNNSEILALDSDFGSVQAFNKLKSAESLEAIKSGVAGNLFCVDCETPNPEWASLNLGALMCIECSGIHRNLGVHISKIRSLQLDDWPPEYLALMKSLGNSICNSVYERQVKGRYKPSPSSPREEKERWIRSKYENKEFLPPLLFPVLLISEHLIKAIINRDLPTVLLLLAHSSQQISNLSPHHPTSIINNSPNSKNSDKNNVIVNKKCTLNNPSYLGKTPLHIAAMCGNVVITQLLLWNDADPNAIDKDGLTALDLARKIGANDCINVLSKRMKLSTN
ncbi:unnamed protein product [Gordionus sp. m RMFG-2023]|uniref:arf-GAP with GTPase, ANK repeat and PH domain-containing protein 3-like n=1 Tax=Gordionus sp. m RMFG-2023 TaxID=3053472 RepID=UPI0030E07A20